MHEYEVFLWKIQSHLQNILVSNISKEEALKAIHEVRAEIIREIRPEIQVVTEPVDQFDLSA